MNLHKQTQAARDAKLAKTGQRPPQKESPATEEYKGDEIADGQIVGEKVADRKKISRDAKKNAKKEIKKLAKEE